MDEDILQRVSESPGLQRWLEDFSRRPVRAGNSEEETLYIPQLKRAVNVSGAGSTAVHLARAIAKAPHPVAFMQLIAALYSAWSIVPALSDDEVAVLEALWRATGRVTGPSEVMTLRTGQSTEEDICRALDGRVSAEEVRNLLPALVQKKVLRIVDGHFHISF